MADVIAIYICGRCYCHQADVIAYGTFCILADVIAMIVVDVKTTVLNVLADGIAKWQMEWPLLGGGWEWLM